MKRFLYNPLLVSLALCVGCLAARANHNFTNGPAHVKVRLLDNRYQLTVDDKPFYIKGAGLEGGSPEKLREHGGNSFRTWGVPRNMAEAKAMLDRAWTNGLYVSMGLDVQHERHGFNYNDANAVARQLALLTKQVIALKDHPALLTWFIGNELNLDSKNPKVWDAVNEISRKIHQIDPNHPTTTALAGFNKSTLALIQQRAPDLDFICFQMYSDITRLPGSLAESGWDKPYIVSEWGATGHWECPKTDWGAPIENNSTVKADCYRKRFESVIQADKRLCLGSYVFLWGQKQERTPTWYGMFLQSGEETAAVDTMHFLWTGAWPSNRCPTVQQMLLNGKTAGENVHLQPDMSYSAKVVASDPENDPMKYSWQVMEESAARTIGGDVESIPQRLPGLIAHDNENKSQVAMKTPQRAGAYRLFVYVFDGHGHAAHANIPFYVDSAERIRTAAAETSPELGK
jgi:hypothetical protein